MEMATIEAALGAQGLILRGGFDPGADDGVPALVDGRPVRTLVMVGNRGSDMWRAFAASPEFATAPDPLNRWSARVIGDLAEAWGARALFPFGGPPHLPFVAWAKRAEPVAESPLGILIHPDYGLWHAYRGALAFAEAFPLPPRGYDVSACADHLSAAAGADCMTEACRARRACPIGRDYLYAPEQARFHMTHFLASRRREGAPA